MAGKKQELTRATAKQNKVGQVVRRQVRDLDKLQQAIAGRVKEGGLDASDIGHLARSTKVLHELEAKAHGFNDQTTKAPAVVLIPVPCEDMTDWQAQALKLMSQGAELALPARDPSRGPNGDG